MPIMDTDLLAKTVVLFVIAAFNFENSVRINALAYVYDITMHHLVKLHVVIQYN